MATAHPSTSATSYGYFGKNFPPSDLGTRSVEIEGKMWVIEINKDSSIRDCSQCHNRLAIVNFCGILEHSTCTPCAETLGNTCVECPSDFQTYEIRTKIDEILKTGLEQLKLSCVECIETVKYTDIDTHLRHCFGRVETQEENDFNLAIQLQFSDGPKRSGYPSRTAEEITTVTPKKVDCENDAALALGLQLIDLQTHGQLPTTTPEPQAAAHDDHAFAYRLQAAEQYCPQTHIPEPHSTASLEVRPTAPPFAQIAQQVPHSSQAYQHNQPYQQPPEHSLQSLLPTYAQATAAADDEKYQEDITAAKYEGWDIVEPSKPTVHKKSTLRDCIIS
ncbi:MAG: hypothetical protein HAW66_10005 [Shewanella sp.]|nr:hypothetical protein [Shewanella sp.]